MSVEVSRPIHVLVVDDSAFMRRVITDILNSDGDIRVIDTAQNGLEAIEKVRALKPDVVTLDVEMPVMDGLTCLKQLLSNNYIPVIMLSGLTKDGADATIQALGIGAVDFITKPTNIFSIAGEEKKRELIEKVKIARNTNSIKRSRSHKDEKAGSKGKVIRNRNMKKIVAIGTSTGGPRALQDVIPLIPGDIPAALLIVQHMPPGFTKSLAERLNDMSELTVKEAEDGERIMPGYAYIAPGDYHLMVKYEASGELKVCLSQSPPVGRHRPAVDTMMKSLSDTGLNNIIGVIMTGMGGDGTEGLKMLKKINHSYIIAQDERSSVVFGMPRVAIQAGIVDTVVPLKDIAGEIVKNVGVCNEWI